MELAARGSTEWTATWLPFFGSLVVALVALAGVVWASNKNARTITSTEILRHKNVVDEALAVATRNEKVAVLLRLIDETTRHILVADDVFQAFRRFAAGDTSADRTGARDAFNAHGATLTSAESAAFLYAPESLVTLAQEVGNGAAAALAGIDQLSLADMTARQTENHAALQRHLAVLVSAVRTELGLRPPGQA
ncbi:hypothetical protein Cch01nite_05960 [Cellulomonas chitinilytica]|uniref:Uncharacterized protein n=1 Tax=Cellulomonas chitinilytica TaxID=398759 RepID=A0A919NYI3_9CELL|nr:hypothetical protein [Cellulomonas chitinilytica]GIG19872.1 hypothetical protein Cch01nite_05960 [Cellulomonas chitinilytica]